MAYLEEHEIEIYAADENLFYNKVHLLLYSL